MLFEQNVYLKLNIDSKYAYTHMYYKRVVPDK